MDCVFKMCINELSNYLGGCREIFFSTYDQPAVGTMAGSQAPTPPKKEAKLARSAPCNDKIS